MYWKATGRGSWPGGFRGLHSDSVSTQTANADIGTRERPKRQGGACGVRPLFTGQNPQPRRRCEEGRHRAPHGESVSNRVWANAAGRRGLFLKGWSLSQFEQCRPLRKRTERGRRKATPKAGDGRQGPGQVQPTASRAATAFLGRRHDFLRFVHEVILIAGGTPEVKGRSAFGLPFFCYV